MPKSGTGGHAFSALACPGAVICTLTYHEVLSDSILIVPRWEVYCADELAHSPEVDVEDASFLSSYR
jgi:hypothetical protein